jgi:hypothetical protein
MQNAHGASTDNPNLADPPGQEFVLPYAAVPTSLESFFQQSRAICWALCGDDRSGLEPFAPVSLAGSAEGLCVESGQESPRVLLPALAESVARGEPLVLRIDLTAPAETEVRVCHHQCCEPGPRAKRSATRRVRAGRSQVFLRIDAPGSAGRLRLELGTAPGRYLLHALELRIVDLKPKCDQDSMPATD